MEVAVVTGFAKHLIAMDACVLKLRTESKFIELEDPAKTVTHPFDITKKVMGDFTNVVKDGKYVIRTNSDHVINALRVLRKQKKIDALKVFHFGSGSEPDIIWCGDNGEFDAYPDGFLDEWSHMMGLLA